MDINNQQAFGKSETNCASKLLSLVAVIVGGVCSRCEKGILQGWRAEKYGEYEREVKSGKGFDWGGKYAVKKHRKEKK